MSDNGQRPEYIQADIERTRTDLDETLSAIERRLKPSELVDQGLDYLRHSGARQYVTNLGTAAKQDPVPLALVGVGLAWLMMSNGRARDPAAVKGDTHTGELAASLKARTGEAATSLKQKAATTTEKLSQTAHATSERAKAVGASARHQVDRVRGGYEYLVHEQPLALGALGLALGVVLAGAVPRSRQEDELMGDASERLKSDLRDAGHEQLDKVKHAATAAKDAAEESLHRDGLDGAGSATPMVRPPVDFQTP